MLPSPSIEGGLSTAGPFTSVASRPLCARPLKLNVNHRERHGPNSNSRWPLPPLFLFTRRAEDACAVAHPDGEAKFWLEPGVTLGRHTGLSQKDLAAAEEVVHHHLQEIIDAWNKHFGR